MHKAQTWRTLLGTIIKEAKEKQRIMDGLGITSITLTRWINGESDPRPQNLRHLVLVLPEYREQLLDLLKEEDGFEDFSNSLSENHPKEIPGTFYEEVLVARITNTRNVRFWSLCSIILEQALKQLDPDKLGMTLWIVRCMPPSGPFKKVRSLHETIGRGTPPWQEVLDERGLLLGAESLAGNVVTLCRPATRQDLSKMSPILSYIREKDENSTAIYPILRAGRVAGAFLVGSKQYNYFLAQERVALINQYADLVALAFEPEDFYPPEDIVLSVMPDQDTQRAYLDKHFRDRMYDAMIEISKNPQIGNRQADLLAWQKIEEEFLQYALTNREEEQDNH